MPQRALDAVEGKRVELNKAASIIRSGGVVAFPTESFYGLGVNAWDEKDMFVPSTLKALTVDGKLYGLPYNTNARVLLYRKDLLEEFGLAVPKT